MSFPLGNENRKGHVYNLALKQHALFQTKFINSHQPTRITFFKMKQFITTQTNALEA